MSTVTPTREQLGPAEAAEPDRSRTLRSDLARLLLAPQAALALVARCAFARPAWVVAAAMLLVCYPETSTDVSASVHITPIDLGSVLIVLAVLPDWFKALIGRGPAPFSRPVAAMLAAVVTVLSLSTLLSTDTTESLSGFVRYVQLFVAVPAATATAVSRRRTNNWSRAAGPILGAMIAIGLFEAAYGSWQALTGNGSSYAGSNVRAVGTFGSLDVMGMATVIGFGMVAALALALVWTGWRRAWAWLALAAMLPAMVFSLSRGSWIATAVACLPLAALMLGRRLLKWTVLGACAALVALALTGGLASLSSSNASGEAAGSTSIVARFTSIFSSTSDPDQSVTDRYSLWTAAIGIGEEFPLSGAGLKQFPQYRDSKAPISLSGGGQTDSSTNGYQVEPLLSPHNMYLLAFAEQGLPGAAVFLMLLVGVPLLGLLRCYQQRRKLGPAQLALVLAAAGWGLWGAIDFLYADIGGPTTVLYSILLGVVLAHALPKPDPAIPVKITVAAAASAPSRAVVVSVPPVSPATSATPAAGQTPLDEIVPGQTTPDLESPPGEPGQPAARPRSLSRLARGSLLTTGLNLGGSVLGLFRDLLLAKFFGASGGTDAFLVAWTVPETAAPLLIEDGMSYLMVPVFSKASRTRRGTRYAIDSTWLPLTVVLSAISLLVILTSPLIVRVLAPGLADPALATTCTRLAGLTVLFFGLTGYAAAGLRSHHVFGSPAAIYLAYNAGILLLMIDGHAHFGVVAAAAGVSVGAGCMVLVQTPSFIRVLGRPGRPVPGTGLLTLGAVGPIVTFALARQAQVFIERYYGSQLDPGTISLLNYSQKVSQVPMSLAVMITAVSFPTLSRAVQSGQLALARQRVRRDLTIAVGFVAASTAIMIVAAPLIIKILFQHGAFTSYDTAATASIMRVYVLGLVGQTAVGVIGRLYFSRRPSWFPAIAMGFGLVVTGLISKLFLDSLGANAIALGNAAGISLTALIMLGGASRMLHGPGGPAAPDAGETDPENAPKPPPARRYDER